MKGYICALTVFAVLGSLHCVSANIQCDAGQTEVKTPYIYSKKNEFRDCPSLIGKIADWYKDEYRSSCQRWMGGAKPDRVEDAYITECHQYSNDTLRYRAEVCCSGEVSEKRCFTCSGETDDYACDYHGTVETCSSGQECATVFDYYGNNGQYCSRKITKGCMDAAACQALTDDYSTTCQNYIDNPQCGFCYPGVNWGNYIAPTSPTSRYCGEKPPQPVDVCSPNPCRYGTCTQDSTDTKGYYCTCYKYSWLNSAGLCYDRICESTSPCQNGGRCSNINSDEKYSCCCKPGYMGKDCTDVVNPGCSDPTYCKNGGTCREYGTGNLRCSCPEGFVGQQCKTDVSKTACVEGTHEQTYHYYSSWASHWTCSNSFYWSESTYLTYCSTWMKRPDGPKFQNGVHGQVSTLPYNGLDTCEATDTCLWATERACCPTCFSAPCLNGGWCIQKNNHDYACKCRFGYEGKNCENKVSLCMTAGDPHHQTLDGAHFNAQGTCKYSMIELIHEEPGLDSFKVHTKYEHRNGNTQVSYPNYVEIVLEDYTVRLGKNNVVIVNGSPVDLDAIYPEFTVSYNGQFVRLETSFSLVVEFDGYWTVLIKLPSAYQGKVTGLCGNYDGVVSNDLRTRDGTDVSTSPSKGSEISFSFQVNDPEDFTCQTEIKPEPVIKDADKIIAEGDEFCGLIKSPTGPFAACALGEPDLAEYFFTDVCVFDTSLTGLDKNVACASIEAYISKCVSLGYKPEPTWRATANCPMACSVPGMTYYPETVACHVTCQNRHAETDCKLENTEACKCPEGQVFHQNKCQEPSRCGCTDTRGKVHAIGTGWYGDGCATRQYCIEGADTWGEIVESPGNCAPPQECLDSGNGFDCVIRAVDGGWGDWGDWSECSQPCGQGTQTRLRKCDSPAPFGEGKPCSGSDTDVRTCVCKAFDYRVDCEKCDLTLNEHGYMADPCSCNHYYQCVYLHGTWSTAHHKSCPACTIWDQSKLACDHDPNADRSMCPDEKSKEDEIIFTGGTCANAHGEYRAIPGEETAYEWMVNGKWLKMDCPGGTVFEASDDNCACVNGGGPVAGGQDPAFCIAFDWGLHADKVWTQAVEMERTERTGSTGSVAAFKGDPSRIEIPYFTNKEISEFSFSLWYKRTDTSSKVEGLVYNGNCVEDGSIQILSVGYNNVRAIIVTDSGETISIDIWAAGGVWNHVALTYDGSVMKLYLNGGLMQSKTALIPGKVKTMQCPLVLGYKHKNGYYKGLMDDVCYYDSALDSSKVWNLYKQF